MIAGRRWPKALYMRLHVYSPILAREDCSGTATDFIHLVSRVSVQPHRKIHTLSCMIMKWPASGIAKQEGATRFGTAERRLSAPQGPPLPRFLRSDFCRPRLSCLDILDLGREIVFGGRGDRHSAPQLIPAAISRTKATASPDMKLYTTAASRPRRCITTASSLRR